MALVLKSWKLVEKPTDGVYVKIVGRAPGSIAWLLSIIGIDATTTFLVMEDQIIYETGSWAGQNTVIVPLNSITRSYYGYEKPWKNALVIGLVLLPLLGLGLIVGPLYYFLNKNMQLGFVEMSGWAAGIIFKRSVIEGVNIDEKEVEKVKNVVRMLIDKQNQK